MRLLTSVIEGTADVGSPRQPLGARMDSRPVQREDAEGPDHPREVQHLQIRGLQGTCHRSAGACHARQRRDPGHCRGHDGGEGRALNTAMRHSSISEIERIE